MPNKKRLKYVDKKKRYLVGVRPKVMDEVDALILETPNNRSRLIETLLIDWLKTKGKIVE